jgi:hypothetical protein
MARVCGAGILVQTGSSGDEIDRVLR